MASRKINKNNQKSLIRALRVSGSNSARWPDGTPRSIGNDFTGHLDGRPSSLANAKDAQAAANRTTSSNTVERMRAMGIEPARISQLTHRPARLAKVSA